MVTCELCGESVTSVTLTKIAGSNMRVCIKCSSMGKNLEPQKEHEHIFKHRLKEDEMKIEVISNYSQKINQGMQKKSLDLHQLARGTNIRESTINKYITNKIKPDIESAKKIEKFLDIKLTEEFKNTISENKFNIEDTSTPKTLGDLMQNLQKQLKK